MTPPASQAGGQGPQLSMHCTLYSILCTQCTLYCVNSLHSSQCTQCTQFPVYTVYTVPSWARARPCSASRRGCILLDLVKTIDMRWPADNICEQSIDIGWRADIYFYAR